MKVRKAKSTDIPAVHQLVMELAVFEKAPEEVITTVDEMLADGFGQNPFYGLLVAEDQGHIIGMALYYYRYSTWKGKMLYLEDLIVTERYRKNGVGTRLMNEVIREAKALKCKGIQWQVLEWNQPAIEFYNRYTVKYDNEWVNCRIMLD